MWHELEPVNGALYEKWVKTNDQGRIVGRVHLKEGEYRASKVVVDAEGIGTKQYLGAFISLERAQAAVDA